MSFDITAMILDMRRLGKQRVEAYQILKILCGDGKKLNNGKIAWENHPAVLMWKGYEFVLWRYIDVICDQWISLGYKDTIKEKSKQLIYKFYNLTENFNITSKRFWEILKIPPWLGDNNFHASHRSNLLRKNKDWYSKFNWIEPDNLPYIWPKGNTT